MTWSVIIERDSEGYYAASVSEVWGCRSQAKSVDELMVRVREAIGLCLVNSGDTILYL
jgi:predicted RNase H-like HicB family nuclease